MQTFARPTPFLVTLRKCQGVFLTKPVLSRKDAHSEALAMLRVKLKDPTISTYSDQITEYQAEVGSTHREPGWYPAPMFGLPEQVGVTWRHPKAERAELVQARREANQPTEFAVLIGTGNVTGIVSGGPVVSDEWLDVVSNVKKGLDERDGIFSPEFPDPLYDPSIKEITLT